MPYGAIFFQIIFSYLYPMKLLAPTLLLFLISCGQSQAPDYQPQIDSLKKEVAFLKGQIGYMDTIFVYEIEAIRQEQRTDAYFLSKDIARIQFVCDSLAKKNPKEGKAWRILGTVIGEALKRVI